MKVIDGKNAVLGRLASYVAKEALKGEEIAIVNCEQILITGNKKNIKENFEAKRKRVGSTQKGPKISKTNEKIVKSVVRGMLPNYRKGKGKAALKRIKCYSGIPKKYEESKKISAGRNKSKSLSKNKMINVKDIAKW